MTAFPTYFYRNTSAMDVDDLTRRKLFDEHLIGIHYPFRDSRVPEDRDMESIDPADYCGSARGAIRALVTLAKSGGYACGSYHGIAAGTHLVGFVQPGSEIALIRGSWVTHYPGRQAVLKAVKMTRVLKVSPDEHASVMVGRPRQGSLMRWPSAGAAIANLVEGRRPEMSLAALSPARQEILCAEFLRMAVVREFGLPVLRHLLLPAGRTMKNIDLFGIAEDGARIFAQVTFHTGESADGRRKLRDLKECEAIPGAHLIFFCRSKQAEKQSERLTIFPLEKVHEIFSQSPFGQLWLKG